MSLNGNDHMTEHHSLAEHAYTTLHDLVWYFWRHIRVQNDPPNKSPTSVVVAKVWRPGATVLSWLCVWIVRQLAEGILGSMEADNIGRDWHWAQEYSH